MSNQPTTYCNSYKHSYYKYHFNKIKYMNDFKQCKSTGMTPQKKNYFQLVETFTNGTSICHISKDPRINSRKIKY